ncbi:MAG TPA: zinc ribbon domain-containing protein [Steroidobacteraceae bacterium]|jgi:putative FmdB family regulatory protein|nr:zinc ribbon domain-containing protein [Steroidobacteraceae bacterium]
MPFYEYQCKHCGHTLEAMQKFTDAPLKKCPHCGKSQLQKLMSAPVFRLKGGGWYETDFKSDQDNKRNLAERPESDASKETKEKTEASGKEPAAADAAKTDKSAEKPADKAVAADTEKKTTPASGTAAAAGGASRRPASGSSKSTARKSAKRPARPVRRAAAKPARRR